VIQKIIQIISRYMSTLYKCHLSTSQHGVINSIATAAYDHIIKLSTQSLIMML